MWNFCNPDDCPPWQGAELHVEVDGEWKPVRTVEDRFEYPEASLDDVMRFFAKEYKPKNENERIASVEWFIDPIKGKVLFKLFVMADRVVVAPRNDES